MFQKAFGKAIVTKTLPLTEARMYCRMKADDGDGNTVTTGQEGSLTLLENHRAVAIKLAQKMGLTGTMYGAKTKDGMVWVFPNKELTVEL